MLPEKISYGYDLPLEIRFTEITEYPLHYHRDIEIVAVLDGEIELKNGSCRYILPEGSIFTNNGREVHGLYSTGKENCVAVIHIDNAYFSQHFPYLSKSSYRTYTLNENDERFDRLRESVLGILSLYLRKGIDYKQQCIEETISLIDFLNRNFNLFSFDGDMVVSPTYDNLLTIERMSRIIPYIYEHHAERITLEDLSEIEHLSTYYISHMIKTCTGLSFREFLAFARVEFSEMLLLQTDDRISAIAKAVGFSTTSYYEKFFKRWFGTSPDEHRKIYSKMVKSPLRPERSVTVSASASLSMVQQRLSELRKRSHGTAVRHLNLYVRINAKERPLAVLKRKLIVDVTENDHEILGDSMTDILKMTGCTEVRTEASVSASADTVSVYGLDSVAGLVHIFRSSLISSDTMTVKLMDSGSPSVILKGDSGMLTSSGLCKPAYYAFRILSMFRGDLISYDDHYAAVRINDAPNGPVYMAAVMNYSDDTERICSGPTSLRDAQKTLEDFRDELDINLTLHGISGRYAIKKYSFSGSDTLFDFLARLGFPEDYTSITDIDLNYHTVPATDTFTDEVTDSLHMNFTIKGAGLQLAMIEPLPR